MPFGEHSGHFVASPHENQTSLSTPYPRFYIECRCLHAHFQVFVFFPTHSTTGHPQPAPARTHKPCRVHRNGPRSTMVSLHAVLRPSQFYCFATSTIRRTTAYAKGLWARSIERPTRRQTASCIIMHTSSKQVVGHGPIQPLRGVPVRVCIAYLPTWWLAHGCVNPRHAPLRLVCRRFAVRTHSSTTNETVNSQQPTQAVVAAVLNTCCCVYIENKVQRYSKY